MFRLQLKRYIVDSCMEGTPDTSNVWEYRMQITPSTFPGYKSVDIERTIRAFNLLADRVPVPVPVATSVGAEFYQFLVQGYGLLGELPLQINSEGVCGVLNGVLVEHTTEGLWVTFLLKPRGPLWRDLQRLVQIDGHANLVLDMAEGVFGAYPENIGGIIFTLEPTTSGENDDG